MRNIVVLVRDAPSREAVMTLLERWGGTISKTGKRANIEHGEAGMYIDFYSPIVDYEEDELKGFVERIGVMPRAMVSVHFRGNEQSEALAYAFCDAICVCWGGIIDENP